jgi:hypothetical protein
MKQIIDMSTAENVMEKKDDNNFDTINDRHVFSSLFSFFLKRRIRWLNWLPRCSVWIFECQFKNMSTERIEGYVSCTRKCFK